MSPIEFMALTVIVLALGFDFLNGFHDAANAIATVVVTRTLSPGQAVLLAGIANYIGYLFFGFAIAKMVSKGIINLDAIATPESKLTLLIAALVGASIWNIITWIFGLPTSSSHAIIGGMIGAGLAAYGPGILILGSVVIKDGRLAVTGILPIIAFIVIAPLLGLLGAMLFTILIMHVFRRSNYSYSSKIFKYLQLVSATWYSIGHGTNDAQKMMGIITLALFCGGMTTSLEVVPWVALSCHGAIALGTMFGGWRIVKTMGTGITKIRAREGFCAETSAALVLMGTAHFGIPVSTTHVISGAVMGVGTVEGAKGVRWATARKIVWAWLLTIPLTGSCAAIVYWFFMLFHR
jgi:PiT family inorganic phosphate transporter